MKTNRVVFMLAILVGLLHSQSYAIQPDAGMVVKLDGTAFYGPGTAETAQQEVQVFMKVQENDVVKLAPSASLGLVYFSNGRRETWSGPLVIKIGTTQSQAIEGTNTSATPLVTALPETALKEVKRLSPLIDPSKLHRSGGVLVRGKATHTETEPLPPTELSADEMGIIENAEQTYRQLAAQAETDDILPEIYLFSILGDYDQFGKMKNLIDIMRKKQPANPAIDSLAEWLTAQGSK